MHNNFLTSPTSLLRLPPNLGGGGGSYHKAPSLDQQRSLVAGSRKAAAAEGGHTVVATSCTGSPGLNTLAMQISIVEFWVSIKNC